MADPSLKDGIFDRSVIHLAEHSAENGAVGYILNKPTEKVVGEILTAPMFEALKNLPIYFGGPVGTDQIVFSVYWWDDEGEFRYRLRISAEEAIEMKGQAGALVLAHVGHAAWEPQQLEGELEEQAWVHMAVSEKTLSLGHAQMWTTLLEDLSPYHLLLSLTPLEVNKN